MSYYTEVMVTPKDLANHTIIQTNIVIDHSNEVLLTGTVYDEEDLAIQGAVIQLIEVYSRNQRVNKGYVLTNQDGEFAIVVTKKDCIDYQLDIYEPLIID